MRNGQMAVFYECNSSTDKSWLEQESQQETSGLWSSICKYKLSLKNHKEEVDIEFDAFGVDDFHVTRVPAKEGVDKLERVLPRGMSVSELNMCFKS